MRNTTGIISAALLVASMPLLAKDYSFTGKATGPDGNLLYQEQHTINGTCQNGSFRPQQHRVDYLNPGESEPFAWKDLDYNTSVIRPRVHFVQPGFDETLTIRYPQPGTLTVKWDTPSEGSKRFEVDYPDGTVVDSGFDNLVRKHWPSVLAGESIKFRFLAPTRGEHYGFVLEKAESDKVKADHVLQIRPTSMVVGFLIDPIVLGYNNRGALTDYYGLTNIRKNQDSNYNAHIRYTINTYPDCELTP
ncbi:hypothetical protein [Marinobacter subterrani]|uniref:hypothetical protein n=1 Tax=Marinobacter subterrani TaxID=1658765 RepID=UPI0023567006|nr:hypothetical protein [Marinobacter subterrani]